MKLKLSQIFVSIPGKTTYNLEELLQLNIQSNFRHWLSHHCKLSLVEHLDQYSNLCYAENTDINPKYRNTITKDELLDMVCNQLDHRSVDIQETTVYFPDDPHALFMRDQ